MIGGSSEDAFLIGPILDWWDKHSTRRDAKRTAKVEAKLERARQSAADKSYHR